jgi:hypothetical protein
VKSPTGENVGKPEGTKPGDVTPPSPTKGRFHVGDNVGKPGDAKPGDANPPSPKKGEVRPGENIGKPGGTKPGDVKPPAPSGTPKREVETPTPPRETKKIDGSAGKKEGKGDRRATGTKNVEGTSGKQEGKEGRRTKRTNKLEGSAGKKEGKEGLRTKGKDKVEGKGSKKEGKAGRRTKVEKDLPDVSGEYKHTSFEKGGKTYRVSSGMLHKPGTVKVHDKLESPLKPGEFRVTGLARGHHLGARFGATDRAENHDPQNSRMNNGVYKKLENRQAGLIKRGFKVHSKVVTVARKGEAVPYARGVETKIYSPDGKTLLRTERQYFINRANPPASDGKGVKGKLYNGNRYFNRHEGNVIRVGRFQGKKGEVAPDSRVIRRDFGKDNVVKGDFKAKSEKPQSRLNRTGRLRSNTRRPELRKAANDSRKEPSENKGVMRRQQAERVAKEYEAMDKAEKRLKEATGKVEKAEQNVEKAEKQANQAKEKAEKTKPTEKAEKQPSQAKDKAEKAKQNVEKAEKQAKEAKAKADTAKHKDKNRPDDPDKK